MRRPHQADSERSTRAQDILSVRILIVCPACNGSGVRSIIPKRFFAAEHPADVKNPCTNCNGNGKVETDITLVQLAEILDDAVYSEVHKRDAEIRYWRYRAIGGFRGVNNVQRQDYRTERGH